MEGVDVLIVGAGISGIGAARALRERCPGRSFVILEGRERLGGTWDLFRYPGVRSDSDMYTLGYRSKPWTKARSIADGPAILAYLEEAAADAGLGPHIRYGHQVVRARWSSAEGAWTVTAKRAGEEEVELRAQFLFMCTGYYDYEAGYTPELPGREAFRGPIVHPQSWPEDLDLSGKEVVVIGSGATAVTLVPSLAKSARHVTMLQRTPTYVRSMPSVDAAARALDERLPPRLAYRLTRWKNILYGSVTYALARSAPSYVRRVLLDSVRAEVGEAVDVDRHFAPPYDPWDQRLCLVADGDLFTALRGGRASVVTDHIEALTTSGILLRSGRHLSADLLITATGLQVRFLSNIALEVDGDPVRPEERWLYRSVLLSGVPNLALWFGYINASWTLKVDLTSEYVCRLLRRMERGAHRRVVAEVTTPQETSSPFLEFKAGYIQRAKNLLPRQGRRSPWRTRQNYLLDLLQLRFRRIDDGTLRFS